MYIHSHTSQLAELQDLLGHQVQAEQLERQVRVELLEHQELLELQDLMELAELKVLREILGHKGFKGQGLMEHQEPQDLPELQGAARAARAELVG